MLHHCKLKTEIMPFLEIDFDTTADQIINFVDGHGTLSFSSEGTTIAFRTEEQGVDDIIPLEVGDVLVCIAGEMSVYTEESFERNFHVSENAS